MQISTVELNDDRNHAAAWAQDLLKENFLILDTETTGLNSAEICELALIDSTGRPIISTLIKPNQPIPADATAIHGITNQMVDQAPTFTEIHPILFRWTIGKKLCIYNASFDLDILRYCCKLANLPVLHPVAADCAMDWYSQWCGEWSNYHGNYRWQKLSGGDHSALGDCRATLATIQRMAKSNKPISEPLSLSNDYSDPF